MATYDPYEQVKEIYRLKGIYDDYMRLGDTANMEKTKNAAQPYYQQLINNGYANVADDLSKSNYTNAKSIYDKYVASANPQTNAQALPIVKNRLTQEQINSVLSTGNAGTGTQTGLNDTSLFNQYNQYFDDTRGKTNDIYNMNGSFFDKYNQYFDETRGKTNSIFDMIGGNNQASSQSVTNRTNQLWDMITGDKSDMGNRYSRLEDFNYSNPFTTDTGKSVLERYDLAALQGRDNQAAIGGADNGGNIDSYSAANALRQQAALRNLGEQSALAAHDRTVNSGRGILSDRGNYNSDLYNKLTGAINTEANAASSRNQDLISLLTNGYMTQDQNFYNNTQKTMGNYLDLLTNGYMPQDQSFYNNSENTLSRLFNQGETSRLNDLYIDETKQNNALQREIDTSNMTGNLSQLRNAQQYNYVDQNGRLINPNVDYHGEILKVQQELNNTTDPQRQKELQSKLAALEYARQLKTAQPEYSQYANNYAYSGYLSAPTAAVSQQNTQNTMNQTNTAKAFALQEKELDASIDYNNANLEWTKEATRLEMDYKNRGLSQEATNFALGIERDLKVAELNTSVSMDANNVQREINASNERIAKIQSATSIYGVNSNAQTVLKELESKERQFNAELTQRATEFNADNQYRNKELNASMGLNPEYKPTMTAAKVAEAVENGVDTQAIRNDIKYYWQMDYDDYAANLAYNKAHKAISPSAQDYFSKIASQGVNERNLKPDIVANSKRYNISIEDAREILKAFNYSTDWLNDYEDDYDGGIVPK